jgi:hypothetical protein
MERLILFVVARNAVSKQNKVTVLVIACHVRIVYRVEGGHALGEQKPE